MDHHENKFLRHIFIIFILLVESLHPIQDVVLTYNHTALMSLRSRYNVKVSTILTRDDNLFIHNYLYSNLIRSLLNSVLRPSLLVGTDLNPLHITRLCVWLLSHLHHTRGLIV